MQNTLNKTALSFFLPTVNVLQEKALDRKLNFELDFQNNELYVLQEMTRCAALLNYIHLNGKNLFSDNQARVNSVFDTFLQMPDPMAVFVENFEQFFAMYVHSKYGKNSFQLYMRECEKSPVAYPVSVFEDGMCIFMQYNKCELRTYIYNIMTMFYYYTGQNFYEMIRPTGMRTPRPNHFDEYADAAMQKEEGDAPSKDKKQHSLMVKRKLAKSREEKLCLLNRRNLNVNKPFMMRHHQQHFDSLVTSAHFEKCILTNNMGDHRYREVLVGNLQKPIVGIDTQTLLGGHVDTTVLPTVQCKNNGTNEDAKIYQYSEHLNRSRNFEYDTQEETADGEQQQRQQQYKRKTHVQTNFSKVWSCENRRQLVALSIVYSVMDVCIQKITFSLMNNSNKTTNSSSGKNNGCEKIFTCLQNPNGIETDYMDNGDETEGDDGRLSTLMSRLACNFRRDIKRKKPTIQVSFNTVPTKRAQLNINTGCNSRTNTLDNLKFST